MSTEVTNLNDLSDEELLALDPSSLGGAVDSNVNTDPATDPVEVETPDPVETPDEDQSQGNKGPDNADNKDGDEPGLDAEAQNPGDTADPKDPVEVPGKEVKVDEPVNKEDKPEEVQATPEAIVAKLFAPFKANGKEMRVENIDEALDLMRMGANYNKKMSGLKPNLKLLKMLQNNNLLDEGKLEFLIDVSNKNPEAISRLVKESGIDPLDLSDEKAEKYKRSNHAVTDSEMELEGALDEITDSPTALRTLTVVNNEWDDESRGLVTKHPELLKIINGHVESGVYDLISTELDRRRALGRMKGVPDLQAYKQIGDEMEVQGGFKHLVDGSSVPSQGNAPTPVVVKPKTSDAKQDEQRNKQRKAAGGAPPAAPAKAQAKFNPLDMPEEEFLKLNSKFI